MEPGRRPPRLWLVDFRLRQDEFTMWCMSRRPEELRRAASVVMSGLITGLLLVRVLPWQAYGFTRGQTSVKEDQFYGCKKFDSCRTTPLPASEYDERDPRYCDTHGLLMDTPVTKDRDEP